MSRASLSLALIATAAAVVNARPAYVQRIPNGDGVTNVAALGHVNPSGGGPNNQFGLDFKAAGELWNSKFCKEDSDKDGQTNGEELGDPCCEWTKGSKPLRSEGVSHPGDATSTSDPKLWTNVVCANSSVPSTNSTKATPRTPTTPPTNTPANSTSGASTMSSAVYCAIGAAAAIAAFFM